MLNNNFDFKYETPYKEIFEIMKCFNNDTVILQYGAIKLGIIYNILNHINLIQKLKILFLKTDV